MATDLSQRAREPVTQILMCGVTLLALHTTADAFVFPERGTLWSDHLLPGFATLAVLGGLLVLCVYGRPGPRAAVAWVLGGLALEGFALAVVDAVNVRASGDDWTGFLLGPAGVALCAVGCTLLWGSRKPGRLRYLRRTGLTFGAVLGVYVLVAPVAVAILATHRPRHAIARVAVGWPYQPVTLRTSDGLRLAGWYVRSHNGAAVISYPTRTGKLPQARMLIRHGYGVLLLDARGYDGSEGAPNMFGWGQTEDLNAAVAWLRRQSDVHGGRIGGIGFSVGGEMMLEAAAKNRRLRAVVSEGAGIRSIREELLYGARSIPMLPTEVVQTAALTMLSGTPPPPSLHDLARRIAPRAVFLIYAEHGAGGEELNENYYRAAGEPKKLWRVEGAGHTGGLTVQPRAYEQRVVGFFDSELLGDLQATYLEPTGPNPNGGTR